MKTRLLTLSLLVLTLASCEELPGMILPFDGRTAIADFEPLIVQGGANEIPPGYPPGDVITVVDLEDGGFVEGTVVTDGADVLFHPQAPWQANRRFAWTFLDAEHVPHGPEMPATDGLAGTAVFSTSDAPEVLAVEEVDGHPCLVLSQAVPDADLLDLRVTVDDSDVEPGLRSVDAGWDPYDGGAFAVCLEGVAVVGGQSVRAWIDGRGPWRHPAEAHDTIVARLFREVQ